VRPDLHRTRTSKRKLKERLAEVRARCASRATSSRTPAVSRGDPAPSEAWTEAGAWPEGWGAEKAEWAGRRKRRRNRQSQKSRRAAAARRGQVPPGGVPQGSHALARPISAANPTPVFRGRGPVFEPPCPARPLPKGPPPTRKRSAQALVGGGGAAAKGRRELVPAPPAGNPPLRTPAAKARVASAVKSRPPKRARGAAQAGPPRGGPPPKRRPRTPSPPRRSRTCRKGLRKLAESLGIRPTSANRTDLEDLLALEKCKRKLDRQAEVARGQAEVARGRVPTGGSLPPGARPRDLPWDRVRGPLNPNHHSDSGSGAHPEHWVNGIWTCPACKDGGPATRVDRPRRVDCGGRGCYNDWCGGGWRPIPVGAPPAASANSPAAVADREAAAADPEAAEAAAARYPRRGEAGIRGEAAAAARWCSQPGSRRSREEARAAAAAVAAAGASELELEPAAAAAAPADSSGSSGSRSSSSSAPPAAKRAFKRRRR